MNTFLRASFLLLICFSCKEETPAPTKTELLTGKPWKWVGGAVTPAFDVFSNGNLNNGEYWSQAPKCWQDDIRVFTTAGKFTHEEGATKCNVADPQIYAQGTWQFDASEKVVKINDSALGEQMWEIQELTATSLKVVEVYQEKGKTYTFNYSFTR
ncbi:hypothetical protein [Runella aurantiaca]|uniref:Lipocalin-like domain-containing protein n=1 Tax=Runella aurantiaca TaxID=2282308 RepID=A0A369IDI5_9BACT|nr:hypothetical protein [Runella aurantiaca]RDB07102.1 hypothetical protein DVG78_03505 [Runella aurantiaca]